MLSKISDTEFIVLLPNFAPGVPMIVVRGSNIRFVVILEFHANLWLMVDTLG